MTYPSLYSIVQFKPYRETEEFVNVGVVLCCPSAGFIGHRLSKSFIRINHFFSELEIGLPKKATRYIDAELCRIKELSCNLNNESLRNLFIQATKHREGIILFNEPRPILLEGELDVELQSLFDHHVGHSFAKHSSPQERLEKQMRNTLVKYKLDQHYKTAILSDGLVDTKIPFVSQDATGIIGAIKPLNLNHESPGKILEEGDKWSGRLRRLISSGAVEATRLLLPIAMPIKTAQLKAAQVVMAEFNKEQITTIDAANKPQIIQFANAHAK